jgi:hypothetical protein
MSYEPEQEMQQGAEGTEGAENAADGAETGAEDMGDGLAGGGEMAFVAETKQPMNKGTLVVVGLLIACGAATYFMYVRSGPDQAVAASSDPNADAVVKQFLEGKDQNVSKMSEMLKSTEKVVQQFRTEANETQIPLAKLATNPFQREKPRPSEDRTALEKAEQIRLGTARATESVGELKLQTIIHKDPRKATAMINNTLYRKGQKITAGESKVVFTVDEIRPDAVVLSTPVVDQSVKFELKMKQ